MHTPMHALHASLILKDNMPVDLIMLNKQDTMRLFTIRDRTFYSWIEKGIIVQIEELDGQKRYDVSKALKLKNINPADVTSLLAKPVSVVDYSEETEEEFAAIPEKVSADQELISNLKNQIETLKTQLSDERDRSKEVLSKIGLIENQQKLLAEIRNNETQQLELFQKRENALIETFQERMKDLIVLSHENENQQYDKILESVKQVQTEREKSLKGLVKMSLSFVGVFFLFTIMAFATVYHFQNKKIYDLNSDKENQSVKMLEAQEKIKEEIKANADRLISFQKLHEQEKKSIEENMQKRLESEKQTLINFYNQNMKTLQTQIEMVTREKSSIKDDKDEIRLQIQILDAKFKSVLEEISNEKKNNSATLKEQEGLRKSLSEITESLNKLREKSSNVSPTPPPVESKN